MCYFGTSSVVLTNYPHIVHKLSRFWRLSNPCPCVIQYSSRVLLLPDDDLYIFKVGPCIYMTNQELWKTVLGEIELSVSRPNFLTWFKNTDAFDKREGVFVVHVPNNFIQDWLKNHYERVLLKLVRQYAPEVRELQFVVGKDTKKVLSLVHQKTVREPRAQPLADTPLLFEDQVDKTTNLNPRYTFVSFVVGPSNELAHAAARAVTESPGTLYNPLFIYGGVGLGKTHLLQSVGNELLTRYPNKKTCYISCEKFTNEFIFAIKNKLMEEFKERYRSYDALLIDDVQFISGKDSSQEELFHTFNELQTHNKQVIFSSDRPPKSIPTIEERLRSRFEGGMIADINHPDFEMRIAILRAKAQERGINLSDRVAAAIAAVVQRNIRELEGALTRVTAEGRGTMVDFDEGTVRKILLQAMGANKKASAKQIIRIVAEYYDLEEKDILQKSRRQEIVRPRQVAMYLMREELQFSYPTIGGKFGGRDHTTVIHACEKIDRETRDNNIAMEELNAIRDKLRIN